MTLWGLKDGMSDSEINKEIESGLGKTIKERIKLVKSGKFDDWNIDDLV